MGAGCWSALRSARRIEDRISAGNLNTFLRSLRTLVTHATSAICSFCRKPNTVS